MAIDNLIQKLEQEASKLKGAPKGVSPTAKREFTEEKPGEIVDSAEVSAPVEDVDTKAIQLAKDYVDFGKIPSGFTQKDFEAQFAPEIEMARAEQEKTLSEMSTKEGDPELLNAMDKFADQPVLKTVVDGKLKNAEKK